MRRRAAAAASEETRQHDGVEEDHRAGDDGEERDEEADLPRLPVEEALRVEQEGGDASRRAAQSEHLVEQEANTGSADLQMGGCQVRVALSHEGGTQPVEPPPSLAEQRAHERGRRAAQPVHARRRRHAHLHRVKAALGREAEGRGRGAG